MKYKNIELIAGEDSSTELLIHVWISDDVDDDFMEYVDCEFCIDLQYHIRCCGWKVDVTRETEQLVTVRMIGGVGFNRKEVGFFVDYLYKEVSEYVAKHADVLTVKIGVHVDDFGEAFCFFDADGNWYNEDSVTPEEFLANIEY